MSQVAAIQRSRLLAATAAVLGESDYERATVADITARARVSRRTFYELFASREDCVAALIADAANRLRHELSDATLRGLEWRERIRLGLWRILCFLDREPRLAYALLVQTARGGGEVLSAREAKVLQLVRVVDEGREQNARVQCSELTAEGVVGAALAILQARLMRGESGQLRDLHGELLALIVLPYLGAAAARREQTRLIPAEHGCSQQQGVEGVLGAVDPLADLRMRVTYRTARVLEGIGLRAGSSNRQVADYAGIHDQGQVSKLLSRLERLGLLVNHGAGHNRGEANAWVLTSEGQRVAQSMRIHGNRHNNEREETK